MSSPSTTIGAGTCSVESDEVTGNDVVSPKPDGVDSDETTSPKSDKVTGEETVSAESENVTRDGAASPNSDESVSPMPDEVIQGDIPEDVNEHDTGEETDSANPEEDETCSATLHEVEEEDDVSTMQEEATGDETVSTTLGQVPGDEMVSPMVEEIAGEEALSSSTLFDEVTTDMAGPSRYDEVTIDEACSKIQEKIVGTAIPCPMEAMRNSVCLDSAKNCLVVRPRSGEDQIRFIQKCLPNLEALTAIDIDFRSLAKFHENISQCFPNMSITFSPESSKILSEWSGPESQFDVVLLFYPVTPFDSERTKALLEKCLLRWLKPGGSVFISNSCWDEDTERIDTTVLVLKALDKNYRAYRIKEFISSLGFCVKREFSSEMRLDVSNSDPDVLQLFKSASEAALDATPTDAVLKELLGDVAPDGVARLPFSVMQIQHENA